MKAEIGRTYAQIVNNRVHLIFTGATLPEWNEKDIEVVDVTGNVPALNTVYRPENEPTKREQVRQFFDENPRMRALVKVLMVQFGITKAQMLTLLENNLD